MGEVTRIRGHAAVYDRVDRTGDVMRRGLFGALRPVPLLAQHRGPPVGTIAAIGEDALGVWIEATIEDAAAARLVRGRGLAGLSVGYRPVTTRQGAWREIVAAELIEVSLVAQPAQPAARVEWISSD
ncbi:MULTISPECIES: HK97 family phage prohead protease [Sphingomonas]|uniref:HK97 family phage prohead protease n=1 Tax=Sphingomonas lycopersici TaxID=2951807 RepID=A0AA41Z6I3_9SPHN|nr:MULTISPECIES: HK97 family phage prohead protease [Sphingomonas]MCW6532292.1 HK97 family phage prohead protease [Sphingomonas lycopersici]MCW6534907.1 HK97 family phage prohead protease [Sphingomonas lycopersici]OJU17042.1 MAG: peptidase U35 [Sphingomonas sp. 66-10]